MDCSKAFGAGGNVIIYWANRAFTSTEVFWQEEAEDAARRLGAPGGYGSRLAQRQDLFDHSPYGFEWGYSGSGPAQLALALCAHTLGEDDDRALRVHQGVKELLVVPLRASWVLSQMQVLEAIRMVEANVAHFKRVTETGHL